jgi:hypothetical protein
VRSAPCASACFRGEEPDATSCPGGTGLAVLVSFWLSLRIAQNIGETEVVLVGLVLLQLCDLLKRLEHGLAKSAISIGTLETLFVVFVDLE